MSEEHASKRVELLKYLYKARNRTVYQSDISKELGLDPRMISKYLIKFEEEGLIERKEVLYKGKKTYVVVPNPEKIKEALERLGEDALTLEELMDKVLRIPCITCPNINRCYEGGFYDPTNCNYLTEAFKHNGGE